MNRANQADPNSELARAAGAAERRLAQRAAPSKAVWPFLQVLLRHPQQLLLRRAAFQLHLWAGVLLALYIVAIGLSGSLMVFKQEQLPRPHARIGSPAPRGCTPVQLAAALSTVMRAYPAAEPYLAACSDETDPLIAITLRPRSQPQPPQSADSTIFLDPESGELLGARELTRSWVDRDLDARLYAGVGAHRHLFRVARAVRARDRPALARHDCALPGAADCAAR